MKQDIPLLKGAKYIFLILFLLVAASPARAQFGQIGEKVRSHLEADPLTISGQLGASMQSIYNNRDVYAGASPFALTSYANFNIGIYGFNIPININLMNIASTQFSFPHPQIDINMTPTWKNFRFHIGTSSMHFSNYTYSGLNFTGLGAEYQGKLFRAAAFYGIMQSATIFKEMDNRSAIQYMADSLLGLNVEQTDIPQFKRVAYGGRIGIGSSRTFLDFSVFKAKDDSASLPNTWPIPGSDSLFYRDSIVQAKENLDLGLSGRVSLGRWFVLSGNLGASLYTDNQLATPINSQSLADLGMADSGDAQLQKVMGLLEKVDWLYTPRLNTQLRFAGDASASFNFKYFNTVFTYRFVQADYTSLGANRFSQNAQGLGNSTNLRLFKGTTTLGLSGYLQHDNLDGKQMYTNQVITYAANFGTLLFNQVNLALSYSGVKQDQLDGTKVVNDSTRTDQLAHTFTFSPSYSIEGDNIHTISLNFNIVENKNLNPLMSHDLDVNTLTAGAGYTLGLTQLRMDVGVNYDYSKSDSRNNSYTSHALGASFGYVIAKNDKLNLKANYVMSMAFNNNADSEMQEGGLYDPENPVETAKTSTLSFSNRLGMSFSYDSHHNAQLYLSSSNYSENIVIGQKITTDFDLRINFSYSYSFAKRIIKSKKKSAEEEEKVATVLE